MAAGESCKILITDENFTRRLNEVRPMMAPRTMCRAVTAVVLTLLIAGCAGGADEAPYPSLPSSSPPKEKLLTKEEQQRAISEMAQKKNAHKTDAMRQIEQGR